jgi:hypothetical protein
MGYRYRESEDEDNKSKRREMRKRPRMKVSGLKGVQAAKARYEKIWSEQDKMMEQLRRNRQG